MEGKLDDRERRTLRAFLQAQLHALGAPGDAAAETQAYLVHVGRTPRLVADLVAFALQQIDATARRRQGRPFADVAVDARRAEVLTTLQEAPKPLRELVHDMIDVASRLGWLVIHAERSPAGSPAGATRVERAQPPRPRLDRRYDVCVIGSGAGGAVAASRLAAAGREVLVLESGDWIEPRDFPARDDVALQRLYRDAGVQLATDTLDTLGDLLDAGRISAVNVLQAHVVGGGPTVNNAIHLRMPRAVFDQWVQQYDFPVAWDPIVAAMQRVEQDLGVGTNEVECAHGWRSAVVRTPEWGVLPVSLRNCLGCGRCNMGCPFGRKTGGLHGRRDASEPRSYLERALEAGAPIACRAPVRGLVGSLGGRIDHAVVRDGDDGGREVAVRADEFVLAAGPIASTRVLRRAPTPPLLVGRRLSANVVAPVFGLMRTHGAGAAQPGLQMCYYVGQAGDLLWETWFHFPGSVAASLPGWFGANADWLRRYDDLACVGVVVPTGPNGFVRNDKPVFDLTREEFLRMRRGIAQAARFLVASGAERVAFASRMPITIEASAIDDVDEFLRQAVPDATVLTLATAHLQGGNPIARSSTRGVVGADFRVHGMANLTLADSSIFPAGCGVNPQLTTMALAHLASDAVAARGGS